ncbi:MAG: hypothetical protein CM1200mP18_09240 [Gammaproteobacteria bacterium]|nr:MAG: hypothetical protein CM1200mP18_09240 [Gammaproteobacteria bacterium]
MYPSGWPLAVQKIPIRGQLFLGVEESRIHSHRRSAHQELGEAINIIMDTTGSALLVMHSTVDATSRT